MATTTNINKKANVKQSTGADNLMLDWSAQYQFNVQTYNSNTILTNSNSIVLVNASSGPISITLAAPAPGKMLFIKKIDSTLNPVNIYAPSGTIDGATSQSIGFQYDSFTITSDGTNFFIV